MNGEHHEPHGSFSDLLAAAFFGVILGMLAGVLLIATLTTEDSVESIIRPHVGAPAERVAPTPPHETTPVL